MSEEMNQVVDNVKQGSSWLRILFMIGYCVALYVAGIVVLVVMVAQALFMLFTGSDNANLRRLGLSLAEYVREVLHYITYNSELQPFPLSPFPDTAEIAGQKEPPQEGAGGDSPPAAPSRSKPAARKRAPSKTAVIKKKPAGKSTANDSDSGAGPDKDGGTQ